jgi:hypothetical protein
METVLKWPYPRILPSGMQDPRKEGIGKKQPWKRNEAILHKLGFILRAAPLEKLPWIDLASSREEVNEVHLCG